MHERTRASLLNGKQQLRAMHMDDPNVTAIGIGFRHRGGETVIDEPVVQVMVAKKRPAALVSSRRLLPATVSVDGQEYGVDVVEAGPFALFSTPTELRVDVPGGPLTSEVRRPIPGSLRPLRPGISIGPEVLGQIGTLGCFVKDNVDDRVCLLSTRHLLAQDNVGRPRGASILQPAPPDGGAAQDRVATLRRYTPMTNGTSVDAAIAVLDPAFVYEWEQEPAKDGSGNVMPAISSTHPAVGMIIAGDTRGNCFMSDMSNVLSALNVRLIGDEADPPPGPGPVAATAAFGTVEKVGRTTGYSSSRISARNVEVKVNAGPTFGTVLFQGLISVPSFALPGDSGAVACAGGTGNVRVQSPSNPPCAITDSVGTYFGLPLVADNDLADSARDDFLTLSWTGRLLITTVYVNTPVVNGRLAGKVGDSNEQAQAQTFYDMYRPLIASVLANPNSTVALTSEHVYHAHVMLQGLRAEGLLTVEEYEAGLVLHQVLEGALGLNRKQMVTYMNRRDVYLKVYRALAAVPTLELTGPVKVYPR